MNATSSSRSSQTPGRQPAPGRRRPNCHARDPPPAELREVDRRQHEADVLDDRVGDRHPGGRVRARDLRARARSAGNIHDQTADARPAASPPTSAAGRGPRRGRARVARASVGALRTCADRPGSPRRRSPSPRPPSARWRTGRRSNAISAAEATSAGRCSARVRGRATPPARCRAGRARRRKRGSDISGCEADGVGERQRQGGDHVDAIGERQPAQDADDGRDRRHQEGEQHQVVPGRHERAARAGGEVDVRALERRAAGERPRTPPRSAVPDARGRDRRSACPRPPGREAAPARRRRRGRGRPCTGRRPARQQREPQRVAPQAVARAQPARSRPRASRESGARSSRGPYR